MKHSVLCKICIACSLWLYSVDCTGRVCTALLRSGQLDGSYFPDLRSAENKKKDSIDDGNFFGQCDPRGGFFASPHSNRGFTRFIDVFGHEYIYRLVFLCSTVGTAQLL